MADEDGGFFVMGGEGDDGMPEELREILRSLIGGVQQKGEPIEDVLKPTAEQYKLGPGDLCLIINEPGEKDESNNYHLAKVLDPEEWSEAFPDWEDRLMNSYLLTEWTFSTEENSLHGWIPRIRLVRLEPWQWDAIVAHNTGRTPLDTPCDWLSRVYGGILYDMAMTNPDKNLPVPLRCGECGELTVAVEIKAVTEYQALAGYFPNSENRDPQAFYGLSNLLHRDDNQGKLRCLVCETVAPFDLEEHHFMVMGD